MSGKKPLGCLILHGFSGSLDTVRPIAAVCEELHLPYRMPVLRGHSSKPEDLLQVEHDHWIEDAKAAALELVGAEVDELCVIGLSMGGLVALQLAVDPELKVRELILLAPALKFADFRLEFVASKSSSNTRRTMVSAVNMFGAYKPGPDGFEDLERKKACTNYPRIPTMGLLPLVNIANSTRQMLHKVKVPVTTLFSKRDKVVHRRVPDMLSTALRDQHRTVYFDKGGHEMLQDVGNEEVQAEVKSILQALVEKMATASKPAAE